MPKEKTALITGANCGIGFEICRQLGKSGIGVMLTARDEPEDGPTGGFFKRRERIEW